MLSYCALVQGLKFSGHFLGLFISFLALTSASIFGTPFYNPSFKEPALLGNTRSFMGKVISSVLCLVLEINHMGSTYMCIIHNYSSNNAFTV